MWTIFCQLSPQKMINRMKLDFHKTLMSHLVNLFTITRVYSWGCLIRKQVNIKQQNISFPVFSFSKMTNNFLLLSILNTSLIERLECGDFGCLDSACDDDWHYPTTNEPKISNGSKFRKLKKFIVIHCYLFNCFSLLSKFHSHFPCPHLHLSLGRYKVPP